MPIINPLTLSPSSLPQSANPAQATSENLFQSVLSLMMAGSLGSGETDQAMLAPVMALLLDRLLEYEVRDESSSAARTAMPAGSVSAETPVATATGTVEIPSGRPVQGGRLTQAYHAGHNGLDFGVVVGTPVTSTMDGKVIYSGWNNQGYGNLVIIENGPYRTYYAHLSEMPLPVGAQVRAGEAIARSGNTGNSTGPHLHYEIRYNHQAIDPSERTLSS